MFGVCRRAGRSAIIFLIAGMGASNASAGCASLRAAFETALAAQDFDHAKDIVTAMNVDVICHGYTQTARDRRVALELRVAEDPHLPPDRREALLVDAAQVPDAWLAAWKLADLRAAQRRFAEASDLYDEAIQRAGVTGALSDANKVQLTKVAAAAKNLANNDREGNKSMKFAASTRYADGVGGVLSSSLRAIVPVAVPLPINFEFRTANMTPNGGKAADELVDAIRAQRVTDITLVGHTDERGGDQFNMELSLRRVQRVAEYIQTKLQGEGAKLHFTLVPQGKRQPFDVSILSFHPTQEEKWALDRRVDWVR